MKEKAGKDDKAGKAGKEEKDKGMFLSFCLSSTLYRVLYYGAYRLLMLL